MVILGVTASLRPIRVNYAYMSIFSNAEFGVIAQDQLSCSTFLPGDAASLFSSSSAFWRPFHNEACSACSPGGLPSGGVRWKEGTGAGEAASLATVSKDLLIVADVHFFSMQVTCGSVIKLEHVKTGHLLHSHEVSYGAGRGSGQQSVTGYPEKDSAGSMWIVRGGKVSLRAHSQL